MLAWHLGKRTRIVTEGFISKLRWATADALFQLTTDGFQPYIGAVDAGLSDRVDFVQLVKVVRHEPGRRSPGTLHQMLWMLSQLSSWGILTEADLHVAH
ncbi:MAG TPA: hypothetical protein VFQ79_01745 [Bryobacteraceae bacterium]|nr:hypothetical protein [Bryobacteraceae bacterium]